MYDTVSALMVEKEKSSRKQDRGQFRGEEKPDSRYEAQPNLAEAVREFTDFPSGPGGSNSAVHPVSLPVVGCSLWFDIILTISVLRA